MHYSDKSSENNNLSLIGVENTEKGASKQENKQINKQLTQACSQSVSKSKQNIPEIRQQ